MINSEKAGICMPISMLHLKLQKKVHIFFFKTFFVILKTNMILISIYLHNKKRTVLIEAAITSIFKLTPKNNFEGVTFCTKYTILTYSNTKCLDFLETLK